jgi:hypothetical protein
MKKAIYIALLAALTPAHMLAQEATPAADVDDVRRNARMHVGVFYFTPTVQLKELGWDTNVFNTSGQQKSDFMFTLAPKIDLWVPFARRALVRTTVASDLVWYAKYETERSVDPQFTVRGEAYLHRLTLFAEDGYLNTRQRPNFEIDLRSRHLENDLTAGAELRLTSKFSVEVAARRALTRYQADAFFNGTSLQQTLNRDTDGFRVVARHRATPLTTIALRYEDLRDRFPYADTRDSDSYRLMPGVEFKPRALISGTAYVGYRGFNPKNPSALPEFSGLVSQIGLSYTLLGSTTFGVSYRRDLTYSYEALQPFFVDDSVGSSVRRALGRRFDVLVSIDRHRYDYRDLLVQMAAESTPSARVPERIDTTWNYGGSIGYRFGRAGRIGFGVSYYDRKSTTRNFRAYNGLRSGTTITYGF